MCQPTPPPPGQKTQLTPWSRSRCSVLPDPPCSSPCSQCTRTIKYSSAHKYVFFFFMHLFSIPASPRLRVAGSCFHQNWKGEFKLPPHTSPHPPKQTKSDGSSPFFCETLPLHLIKGLHLLPITICCRNTLPFTISRCCGNYSPTPPRLLHLWHNSAVVVIELKSCYRTCWGWGLCNL